MPPSIAPPELSIEVMDRHDHPLIREEEEDGRTTFFKKSSSTPTSAARSAAMGLMFERRKRRKPKPEQAREEPSNMVGGVPKGVDPYESDPGESYREHCARNNQYRALNNCLSLPQFLLKNISNHDEEEEVGKNGHHHRPVHHHRRHRRGGTDDDEAGTESPDTTSPRQTNSPTTTSPGHLPRSATRIRYSLRSTITDGTDPQPTGPSVLERRKLRPNDVKLNISHWSDEGGRPYMEDRYVLEDLDAVQVEVAPAVPDHHRQSNNGGNNPNNNVEVTYRGKRRITMPLTFCGVFDGHGGDHASQFCSDWMSSYLRNDENYPYDLGLAMKNAFNHVDDDFVATGQPDGTTACCVTLVGGRRIVCANAGDSRAIVVRRDGSIVRLSRDHKPGMPDETRRISELGGRVIYWGRWRVEGLLAVSRSIGDASLKPFITAEPEICEYDVGKDDLFLIVSSDGIWDVMDNDEVAHVVLSSSCAIDNGRLVIDTARFKTAAKNLCQHAKASGSADNFAVIVVDLKSCGNPSSASGRYDPCS